MYRLGDKGKRVLLGICCLTVGMAYLGDHFQIWNFTLFFEGWIALLFIVPSLCSMLYTGINCANFGVVLLGMYWIGVKNDFIPFPFSFSIVFAVVAILLGMHLIFTRRVNWNEFRSK